MKIKVRKFNDRKLVKVIKYAINYYADRLLPDLKNLIELEVICRKIPADGTLYSFDQYDYEIEINKNLDVETILVTLAHEMVHLKQYATKQLKSKVVKGKEIDIWLGKKYKNLNYLDQPWEKEATKEEYSLFVGLILNSLMDSNFDIIYNLKNNKDLLVV